MTTRDVSAQVALERLREDMTQMLVHDLRTPLATIIMGLEMTAARSAVWYSTNARTKTYERTQLAARRLLSQVNLLLDVSKLESGHMELEWKPCDFLALAYAAVGTIEMIAHGKNQRLRYAIADDVPVFLADTHLLRRVLENLLSNACKFAPPGSEIVLGAQHEGQQGRRSGSRMPGLACRRICASISLKNMGQVRVTAREGTGLGLAFLPAGDRGPRRQHRCARCARRREPVLVSSAAEAKHSERGRGWEIEDRGGRRQRIEDRTRSPTAATEGPPYRRGYHPFTYPRLTGLPACFGAAGRRICAPSSSGPSCASSPASACSSSSTSDARRPPPTVAAPAVAFN